MAVIMQDDAQVRALEEINAHLDEVRAINTLINSKKPYSIVVNKKQALSLDSDLSKRVMTALELQRTRRIKEINTKASKFRISLDEADLKVISPAAVAAPAEDKENPAPEP